MATTYTAIAVNKRRSAALVFAFVALLGIVGWAIDAAYGDGTSYLVLALVIAVGSSLIGYYSGDRIALWTAGARPVTKEQNPYLVRIVENLSIAAGLPAPAVYVMVDPAINAFATGRDPKHASIAVTTGAIEKLENEELEGVLAHELSHIGNFDVRYMTLVGVLVGAIVLVADIFFRMSLFGAGRGRRDNEGGGGNVLAIIGLVLIILSPIIAQLIKLAISRKREFLADASGALLTRYPEGLARALEKIGAENRPMQRASNATAHLFIANPFGKKGGFSNLFATHPPLAERISALRAMGGDR